jgi:hypothetical protein
MHINIILLLKLVNALSDTSERRLYYELNAPYLRTFSNYEEFCLTIIVEDWYPRELPGKWGYFNEKGEHVIDFLYDYAGDFEDGYAVVKFNNRWGVINKKGQVVIPIDYYAIYKVKGYDLYKIENKNGKTIGFIDVNDLKYFEE